MDKLIDLHTHTIFSDGVLTPSELLQRAYKKNYKAIAITDHVDFSNYEFVIDNLLKLKIEIKNVSKITFIVGVELTHVIPEKIPELAKLSKKRGAEIVVVHGETIVEPVPNSTNHFATLSPDVDILAHPGIISEEDVKNAIKNNIFLEITTRKGHSLTNGHVLKTAKKYNAKLLINNDAHSPEDLVDFSLAKKIVIGAGGTEEDFFEMLHNSEQIVNSI